jgi:hypothetical protein
MRLKTEVTVPTWMTGVKHMGTEYGHITIDINSERRSAN